MQSKLTLRIDSRSIDHAKSWAKAHGSSLSQVVREYFEHLGQKEDKSELGPWTRSIIGAVPHGVKTDEEMKQERWQYLEEKHK